MSVLYGRLLRVGLTDGRGGKSDGLIEARTGLLELRSMDWKELRSLGVNEPRASG
jgi:hypothetical protein